MSGISKGQMACVENSEGAAIFGQPRQPRAGRVRSRAIDGPLRLTDITAAN